MKAPLLGGFHKVLAATRLHFPSGTKCLPDQAKQKLRKYASAIQPLGVHAAIAVSAFEQEIREVLEEAAPGSNIEVLHVPVWGAFVPALNALLGLAQQRSMKHILYHSLEVTCAPEILRKMMDHFMTAGMLVVGPVLDGHTFESGEQSLNGRTTPWNTLALWSVRKLALTGFLNVADGLPARQVSEDVSKKVALIGSSEWWNDGREEEEGIPAGVEEVTAIALLQHLLGKKQARAVLLDLPEHLRKFMTWNTNWQGDAQRTKWHEYKMASKVTRPAAQVAQLFKSNGNMKKVGSLSSMASEDTLEDEAPKAKPHLNFGTVMHFGESIRAPPRVECMCLIAIFLFSANFTAVLASAFRTINAAPPQQSLNTLTFLGLLIGGVFIPLPASLWLTRQLVSRADHREGLVLFSLWVLFGNSIVLCYQFANETVASPTQRIVLVVARLIQGMGSGVLFQSRVILASLSTEDHHYDLQKRQFVATDVGLGIGALLPPLLSFASGQVELSVDKPELQVSTFLTVVVLLYLIWVILGFPTCLHPLPKSVRFTDANNKATQLPTADESQAKTRLVISGTMRIFVQSAIVLAIALIMRDIGVTGQFRQTFVVAALVLLPVPFEMCTITMKSNSVTMCAIGVVLVLAVLSPQNFFPGWSKFSQRSSEILATVQLAVLIIVNATIAPLNVSWISQMSLPERTMVVLEWSKSYIGRLCGPIFALVVYNFLGSVPLVICLCAGTAVVARFA